MPPHGFFRVKGRTPNDTNRDMTSGSRGRQKDAIFFGVRGGEKPPDYGIRGGVKSIINYDIRGGLKTPQGGA